MTTTPLVRHHTRTRITGLLVRRGMAALGWLLAGWLTAGPGFTPIAEAAQVTLGWNPPTHNVDGTPLTDLAGYRLAYGTTPHVYTTTSDVGLVTGATLTNLPSAPSYFFSVTAYNTAGRESVLAPEVVWTPPAEAGSLHHFTWTPIDSPQLAGEPFPVTLTAQDVHNVTVTGFHGSVRLSGSTNRWMAIGTSMGVSDLPMKTSANRVRTQAIYLTNEIGRARWVSALALNVYMRPGQTLKDWTLRLKHTSLQKFTSSSTWESDGWTTVYQNDTTVTATGWITFLFSTPFYYNGADNLMVDFSFNNTNHTSAGYCQYTTVSSNRRLYGQANGTAEGAPLDWSGTQPARSLSPALPNLRLLVDGPVAISPTQAVDFVNGVWSGNVTVFPAAAGVVLRADDGAGHTGAGNAFKVVTVKNTSSDSSMILLEENEAPPPEDSDDDGMKDDQERQAGTDPYDSNSTLKMLRPYRPTRSEDRGMVVEWASVTNRFYTVERSTNLAAVPAFTRIAVHVQGQSPTTTHTDTTATGRGPFFYRVQVDP